MKMIYLDWAATGLSDYNEIRANPSSIHKLGLQAREILEKSRRDMSNLLDTGTNNIIFTSGGTESNNIVLFSPLTTLTIQGIIKRKPKIITSAIEHPSVYEPARFMGKFGFETLFINPTGEGIINPQDILNSLDERVILVSIMAVNNETGAIQPIEEIDKTVENYSRKVGRKIIFHTDAVQALGKIPFKPREIGVDAASFSAHKLGAPRGIGALYIKTNSNITSIFKGGGQEFGKRAGTENLEGIQNFTEITKRRLEELGKNYERANKLINILIDELLNTGYGLIIPTERVTNRDRYSPYILSASFPPIPSEVLVRALSEAGLMVSAGSACSSHNREKRNRVLKAMGISDNIINSTIRFSIGYSTTEDEIREAVQIIKNTVEKLKKYA